MINGFNLGTSRHAKTRLINVPIKFLWGLLKVCQNFSRNEKGKMDPVGVLSDQIFRSSLYLPVYIKINP